jgi:GNAT superfamily N-acetyltransferase
MIRIRPLAETPHLTEIARWLHAEWWRAEGWTLEATAAFLRAATGPAAPACFVAEADGVPGGVPVGTATLDTDDLPSRRDLTPWLASVLVAPGWRGRGVGDALVRHVEAAAASLGHQRLWLITPDSEAFYAARGWARAGIETWQGRQVPLMMKSLGAAQRD